VPGARVCHRAAPAARAAAPRGLAPAGRRQPGGRRVDRRRSSGRHGAWARPWCHGACARTRCACHAHAHVRKAPTAPRCVHAVRAMHMRRCATQLQLNICVGRGCTRTPCTPRPPHTRTHTHTHACAPTGVHLAADALARRPAGAAGGAVQRRLCGVGACARDGAALPPDVPGGHNRTDGVWHGSCAVAVCAGRRARHLHPVEQLHVTPAAGAFVATLVRQCRAQGCMRTGTAGSRLSSGTAMHAAHTASSVDSTVDSTCAPHT
jgi:hypothetical protein